LASDAGPNPPVRLLYRWRLPGGQNDLADVFQCHQQRGAARQRNSTRGLVIPPLVAAARSTRRTVSRRWRPTPAAGPRGWRQPAQVSGLLVRDLIELQQPVEIGWADTDPTGVDPGHLARGPAQDAGSLAARQLRAKPGLPKLKGQLPFPDRRCLGLDRHGATPSDCGRETIGLLECEVFCNIAISLSL